MFWTPDTVQEEGQAAGVWATLMGALDRALLPTQRSKFTQFLLFYAARQVRTALQQPAGAAMPSIRASRM